MIIRENACSDASLHILLKGDESSHEYGSALQHVDSCTACQVRLEQMAAESGLWQEAQEVLTANFESAAGDAEVGRMSFPWNRRPIAWNESMAKSLLEPPSHPELLGRIGRYDVERLIGSGGMGVVFKAYDTELNRPVALKLLAPYLASSGSARKRFAREARAAAAVVDEHVVAIHNVESGDDAEKPPFLVMKYIAGGSLQQRLDRDGPLDVCEILRIGMQTARGLAAAHAQGLIHRDVKPSNILLDEGVERALLTDFGLARAEDDACLTRSGFHPGTPHYMSPEQVRGEAIDGRSDLFSLGCVLYALCTGHPPFRAETSYAILRRITDDTARPIRELNASIPQWLETIVMKLLSKSSDDRFDNAEQVAELLEGCLAHVQNPASTRLPEALVERPKSRFSSLPLRKIGVYAMLAIVSSFILSMLLMQPPEKPPQEDGPVAAAQAEDVVSKKVFPAEVINEVHMEHSQPLFGVWTVEKIVSSGEVVPPGKAPGEIEFRGNQMIWKRTGKAAGSDRVYEFELDMSKSPHWLTFRSQDPKRPQPVLALLDTPGRYQPRPEPSNPPTDEELPQLRIYSLRDADGNPSTQRPTQMGTGEVLGTDLMVLRLKSPFIESMEVYSVGDAISDSLFVDIPTLNADSPGSDKVKAKIAAEADLFVQQIEKSFGPCNLIDFDPSSMALVIDHNASAHEKINKFLQLRAPSAEQPIRLSVIGVSSEWMAEEHEDQFKRWIETAKTLSREEVANVRTWQSQVQQTVGNDVQLTAGKPYTYAPKYSRIPVTIMARHLAQQDSECGMLQVRLDMAGTEGRTSVVGSLSLDGSGSGLVLHQQGSDNFFWLVVPLTESQTSQSYREEGAAHPNTKPSTVDQSESPAIDHRNARSVVEAYVAAALAGDVAKAAGLAEDAPAGSEQIGAFSQLLNLQRLKIPTVYINDPAKPTRALATSVAVKIDEEHKQPDGFLVFTLKLTDEKWLVTDIDFESESGAEEQLKNFIKVYPNSIGLPPRLQE